MKRCAGGPGLIFLSVIRFLTSSRGYSCSQWLRTFTVQIVEYHVAIRRTNGQAHRVMDTYSNTQMKHNPTVSLREAKERAEAIDSSRDYEKFVEITRKRFPWHSQIPLTVLERDYLRVVDHHLQYLIPHVQRYVGPNIRRVLDFGCGSGGSAIALAMVCPEVYFY